jgi:uncharacterized protein YeaO (DUF488 family)
MEPITMIKTKSVKSAIDRREDGLRILATRFRGRGLPSSRYDVWMPNLAPSETLLHDFRSGAVTWSEFGRRYRKELAEDGSIDQRNRSIKNHGQKFTLRLIQELGRREHVTLLCHCDEQEQHCHRHLLEKVLARSV